MTQEVQIIILKIRLQCWFQKIPDSINCQNGQYQMIVQFAQWTDKGINFYFNQNIPKMKAFCLALDNELPYFRYQLNSNFGMEFSNGELTCSLNSKSDQSILKGHTYNRDSFSHEISFEQVKNPQIRSKYFKQSSYNYKVKCCGCLQTFKSFIQVSNKNDVQILAQVLKIQSLDETLIQFYRKLCQYNRSRPQKFYKNQNAISTQKTTNKYLIFALVCLKCSNFSLLVNTDNFEVLNSTILAQTALNIYREHFAKQNQISYQKLQLLLKNTNDYTEDEQQLLLLNIFKKLKYQKQVQDLNKNNSHSIEQQISKKQNAKCYGGLDIKTNQLSSNKNSVLSLNSKLDTSSQAYYKLNSQKRANRTSEDRSYNINLLNQTHYRQKSANDCCNLTYTSNQSNLYQHTGRRSLRKMETSQKKDMKKLITQSTCSTQKKPKRESQGRPSRIKSKAKKQNQSLLRNIHSQKENIPFKKLEIIRNKVEQVYQRDNTINNKRNKDVWTDVDDICQQIKISHLVVQNNKTQSLFNQNSNSLTTLCLKNESIYQTHFSKENLELLWSRLQAELFNGVTFIEKSIDRIRELCISNNISALKPLYLLYKKYFYMRTTLLADLQNANELKLLSLSSSELNNFINSVFYGQKIQKISQQNMDILKNVEKLYKTIEDQSETQLNIAYQVISNDEIAYNLFYEEMIRINVVNFIRLYDKIKRNIIKEREVVKDYGRIILICSVDQMEDSNQIVIQEWIRSQQCIDNIKDSILKLELMIDGNQNNM